MPKKKHGATAPSPGDDRSLGYTLLDGRLREAIRTEARSIPQHTERVKIHAWTWLYICLDGFISKQGDEMHQRPASARQFARFCDWGDSVDQVRRALKAAEQAGCYLFPAAMVSTPAGPRVLGYHMLRWEHKDLGLLPYVRGAGDESLVRKLETVAQNIRKTPNRGKDLITATQHTRELFRVVEAARQRRAEKGKEAA